jgi:hypothetical protein
MQRTGDGTKAINTKAWTVLILAIALGSIAWGQTTPSRPKRLVLVSISDCKLVVLENGNVIRTFPVAVGATVSPSPTGEFEIVNRIANPTYYHSGLVIPPGSQNPVGPRWIGLNKKGYGIHGTNELQSIGKATSHGCIRLRNRDVEQFFRMVRVGDTVEIRGKRDAQIAQIFGGQADTTATATAQMQPAVIAQAGGGQ